MTYRTISTYVDVDVDMDDFDSDELIEELESRGYVVSGDEASEGYPEDTQTLLRSIYEAKRMGRCYDEMVDKLIYNTIGRIL